MGLFTKRTIRIRGREAGVPGGMAKVKFSSSPFPKIKFWSAKNILYCKMTSRPIEAHGTDIMIMKTRYSCATTSF